MSKFDRVDRTQETRANSARAQSWQPPSILPEPAPHPDYVHRWIRKSTLGEADPSNVSKRRREGWEPVRAEDHPELKTSIDTSTSGLVEVGGLILCRMSRETADARRRYYDDRAAEQLAAVNTKQAYSSFANPSPIMPLTADNQSHVEIGRGKFGDQ